MRSKNQAPRDPLPEVAAFIRLVHSGLSTTGPLDDDGLWFSRHDEGSLFLNAQETSAYSGAVAGLLKQYVPREDLSRRSVETLLQDALFAALDLRSRNSTKSFQERLRVEIDRLLALLKAPSETFKCWVPVEGLKLDKFGARFGGITFAKFGPHQWRQITLRRPPRARGANWRDTFKWVRKTDSWGQVCAAVDVSARDFTSAEALALRRIRQTLDVLNLFTDLVAYNHGWLYLRGDTARARQVVPIQRNNGDFTASHTNLEPFSELSWKKLRAEKRIARPLRSLERLARTKNRPDTAAALLLTAAQWAGRATVDRRREQSFLLYMIALETMMLPTQETQGLGHRLRLRMAHLLGRTLAARERIAKQIGQLYGVRSKIVHAGSYEVADDDLGRLRALVKGALFRLLQTPKVHTMNREQLSSWLDRNLLR